MLPNFVPRLFGGQSQDMSSQNQSDQDFSAQPDAGVYNALNLGMTQSVAAPDGSTSTQAGPITSTQTITTAGSGLVFVNTYTGSVSAQYQSAIVAAEDFLESNITNAVTLNVTFTAQNIGTNVRGKLLVLPDRKLRELEERADVTCHERQRSGRGRFAADYRSEQWRRFCGDERPGEGLGTYVCFRH